MSSIGRMLACSVFYGRVQAHIYTRYLTIVVTLMVPAILKRLPQPKGANPPAHLSFTQFPFYNNMPERYSSLDYCHSLSGPAVTRTKDGAAICSYITPLRGYGRKNAICSSFPIPSLHWTIRGTGGGNRICWL
jgi:hypothetical protein